VFWLGLIFGTIRLIISASRLLVKNYFISCHKIRLLKYFRQVNITSSLSWSFPALAHNSQIELEKLLISFSTSSLYFPAYSNTDYSAAPLHLKLSSYGDLCCIFNVYPRRFIQLGKFS
jgi:hypothetical protein